MIEIDLTFNDADKCKFDIEIEINNDTVRTLFALTPNEVIDFRNSIHNALIDLDRKIYAWDIKNENK